MKKLLIVFLLAALTQAVDAATFTLNNRSGTDVYAQIISKGYADRWELVKGSKSYSVGAHSVPVIKWYYDITGPKKVYEAQVNMKALVLNGDVSITSLNGYYSYDFGKLLGGKGNGKANHVATLTNR